MPIYLAARLDGPQTMAMTFQFDPQPDYLLAKLAGAYVHSESLHGIDLILDACGKNKSVKVVIDIRGVQGRLSDMERFNFAEAFSLKYFEGIKNKTISHCRFALLGSYPVLDPNHFGENVAVNRGVTIKNFTDEDKALEWIKMGN